MEVLACQTDILHQRGLELTYEEQGEALNKLAGAVFDTITFNDEGTVWMVTGVVVKGSPSTWTGNECADSMTISRH
jgi:hypothetical protein